VRHSFYFLSLFVFLFACEKADQQTYNSRSSSTFNPIQSDSCLLGEKILFFEDSMGLDDIVHEIPVWRQDNFNVHDSLHINDVKRLYSNYDVELYKNQIAIINTKKLYNNARIFTRLIQFNSDGYQIHDTTFYNYVLYEFQMVDNLIIMELHPPSVATPANRARSIDLSSKTVIFNEKLELIKEVKEPNWGLLTSYSKAELVNPGLIKLKFQVVEMCYGCFDEFWWYAVVINSKGDFQDAYIISPDSLYRTSQMPTNVELKKKEAEIWSK
jgi:hypothetical protein